MKVYISCHRADMANALADALTTSGYAVCSTWHNSTEPRPAAGDAQAWAEKAKRNFDEIVDSDVFVLIASADHIAGDNRVPGGKFVEAGFAVRAKGYGRGHRIFTLGGVENGMLHHPNFEHAKDVFELLAMLRD